MEKNRAIKIVFASANKHKIEEIKALIPKSWTLFGLQEIGILEDIPETGLTLQDNALLKAQFVYQKTGLHCFAEDSGLEIYSLNMEPGVYSARYAGPQRSEEDNMNLLLDKLNANSNRNARFRTVIALIFENKEYLFEGIIEGCIATKKSGSNGFGYDPLFIPKGYLKTFASLTQTEKNKISHRSIATKKMLDFFRELHN